MRELPILFQPNLARAALDGYKTQTRRMTGLKSFNAAPDDWNARFWDGFAYFRKAGLSGEIEVRCPYGKPGDRLWGREPWKPKIIHSCFDMACDCETVWVDYPAGGEGRRFYGDEIADDWSMPKAALKGRPVPSLHMPRWACRLLLDVKRIRIERLHACTETDAVAEGIVLPGMEIAMGSALSGFRNLWNAISGDGSWEANPWVWVIEFERSKQ